LVAVRQSRLSFDLFSTAEWLFLFIVVWLLAGPLSGFVLSTNTWISALFTKGAFQIESTRNLANQVIVAAERIRNLETKLAQAQLELTKLRQQSKDANKLRELLRLKSHADRDAIAADVISRSPDNWFEQITIDKGTLDHVVKGSAVITADGVVGQVISASPRASVIRLLTDPDSKLGVLVPRIGLTGILSGRHQNPAIIDFVPIGTNVEVKDQVVCLGKSGTFPEDHPVGTVISVRRDSNGTNAKIEVKLSENCYDLRQVLVLPPLAE
jgi:rod shape-determining protein MreC